MARIRTIKPEFPQSSSMGKVSRDARLLFILMWTLADDAGRLRGDSRMLARTLFPYDDGEDGHISTSRADVETWMAELEAEGCLQQYEVEGSAYVQVCNWLIHQKIDKPSKSKIPPPPEDSRSLAKPREVSSEDQGSRIEGSKDQGSRTVPTRESETSRAGDGVGADCFGSETERPPPAGAGGSGTHRANAEGWESHRQWALTELRLVYPSHLHTDADWEITARVIAGRITEGETTREQLLQLTSDFAAQVDAKGKRNTEFVENPARHFDGRGRWRGPFRLPASTTKLPSVDRTTWRPDPEDDARASALQGVR